MTKVFKQNQAQQCQAWAQLGAVHRSIHLAEASVKLAAISSNTEQAQRLFNYLLAQAERLDQIINLEGATGESNQLYLAPRGKAMILGTQSANRIAFLGQLIAALLAGNEVFIRFPSQQQLCEDAMAALNQSGVYAGVMSITNDSELTTLLNISRLAVIGAVGTTQELMSIGKDMAETDGILTQLVAVTDLEGCSEMFQPGYLERYCTERVKTVNTTAIGGNASLIELGMG
ncbi:1-pyrroline-5-carboxylate dehydrogenase [Psychrobacter sp.]|uniref:1-pyrroline-5-carboxylate dehydrogenase n=1 Tax=Psychrobacter sp. TaxID=56811 RepID=UPI0025F9AF8C|nr:1-pyrroline-5-carboxylate dehydrogenase [Psychrobacter sp.]